jgi:hypothetical protein
MKSLLMTSRVKLVVTFAAQAATIVSSLMVSWPMMLTVIQIIGRGALYKPGKPKLELVR